MAATEALASSDLATKRDVERLDGKIGLLRSDVMGEIKLLKWMLALVVFAEVMPLLTKWFS